jgi:Circularly permutated YpsA SLOG family
MSGQLVRHSCPAADEAPHSKGLVISKIISGGQTGVDRAALDVAMELGIECGGWCPKGRRAEGRPIPKRYPLKETPSTAYPQRTKRNILDSDATIILTLRQPQKGGTALTIRLARSLEKPYKVVRLNGAPDVETVRSWLKRKKIGILNVAGPRESENPGIHAMACNFLRRLLME